ncbi:MAG: hypothetical protein KatS3mg034_1485 [Vicingaceae bacterium]|nr:MAG: hypothetical protein KatS3mg034_1485 [Vicingaceae bacterium]
MKLVAIAYSILILIVSVIPGNRLPEIEVQWFDKLVHFLMYGILIFLWGKAWPYEHLRFYYFYLIMFGFLYGFVIEVLQYFLPVGRYFSIGDLGSNALGLITGSVILKKL